MHRTVYRIFAVSIIAFNCSMTMQALTIVIHGTLFPLISYYYHGVSCPRGMSLACKQPKGNALRTFCEVLHKADPEKFPLDSLYLFGWNGDLDSQERALAAQRIVSWLKRHHPTESITIFGHSHGGTIALLLAQYLKEADGIIIDKLVLMACPVQRSTSAFVGSRFFKSVYNLYSESDVAQVCEPQGFKYGLPIFSERIFKPWPNLVQAQIRFGNQDPGHNDFLLNEQFIVQVPAIMRLLDQKKAQASTKIAHYTVTIDRANTLTASLKPHS